MCAHGDTRVFLQNCRVSLIYHTTMKILSQNVIWLLIFVAYNYLFCLADDKNKITVGAFFEREDVQSKAALNYAIDTTNMMQQHLKYALKTQILAQNDSFYCCKLLCNVTQEGSGLAAIFASKPIFESLSNRLEIPFILTKWRPASYSNKQTTVNFFPDSYLFSHGLAIIVKNLQWKNFVLLYDSDKGLVKLQQILKLNNFNSGSVIVRQLGPGPDHRPLLKEIRALNHNRIILDCDTENIIEILKQAKEVNLMESSYFNYFLTSVDAHTLDFSVLNTTANITTIRILDFTQTQSNYSTRTETALIQDGIHSFITSVNTLHVTEPIVPSPMACDQKWSHGFRISSFMRVREFFGASGPIGFDSSAKWRPENPEILIYMRGENDSFDALVKNMQKSVLIISSRLGPPYLMERKPRFEGEILTGNSRYEGFSMDLIDAIAGILGFKYEFRLAKDGKYGNYDPETKSWNGLIKDLLDRKADLAICDLTITHQRREVVDFSMPFMRLGISILYKKAEEKDVNIFAFLEPFSPEIWIYTATLYLVVSVILYLVARMAPGDWENPHACNPKPEKLENIWNLKNCLWLTLGSIMTQGCDILPKGISSRLATSMWWFFSLIMTSSYTANLAAFLTMERLEPTIDSAEALAKQTKIKYGTVEGGATQAFFRESNYSTYQKMWTTMIQAKPGVFEKNNADGVKRVQTTKNRLYAFLMESSQIEYEIETKCDLKQVGNWLDNKEYGIAMPIDYPYRSAINTAILKLQEEAKLTELKDKWWKKMRDEPSCPVRTLGKSSTELALDNVGGVFLVLGVGMAVAFVLAILEFLWNVRNISVEEHMTYFEALKVELIFALNVWVTKKRTKPKINSLNCVLRTE
ncbi:glutamate receptor ionotropic, kainate 3 isoform X2 [Tribolium castaneum]|uniref:glutamate receptor ionotropic, kainate 3 isoform X2 n=1 Tax=Tribolium castaneum TaxID=7070 RepID=UPI00046BF34C|nr:PREDICTED: glutamate receptor ionotropic, kainate 3 isoform X2 [Tribolium castaneum]|eukprot:XP_008198458.1 PREDICTED: glutamate receptor ionotropic, kainate 3 isoform X2 [Tribolium castaneum]